MEERIRKFMYAAWYVVQKTVDSFLYSRQCTNVCSRYKDMPDLVSALRQLLQDYSANCCNIWEHYYL